MSLQTTIVSYQLYVTIDYYQLLLATMSYRQLSTIPYIELYITIDFYTQLYSYWYYS